MAVEQTARRGEFPRERFEVGRRREARWVLFGLVELVAVGAIVQIWLASRIVTPWILIDELIYSDLARSLAETGTFHVRGEPIPWSNFGYVVLIAPAWLVTDAQATAYALAKTINVGLGVVAIVLLYVWARRLTTTGYAALAAGLTALMPSLLYAGALMSENGFLPCLSLRDSGNSAGARAPDAWATGVGVRRDRPRLLRPCPEARAAPAESRLRAAWKHTARAAEPPDRFVVAASRLGIAGIQLASNGQLSLYRINPPPRVRMTLEGVYADGWTGGAAALTQYVTPGDRPKRLRVKLSRAAWTGRDAPGTVAWRIGPVVRRDGLAVIGRVAAGGEWTAYSGQSRGFTVKSPPPPYRLEFDVSPTFSPSRLGKRDTPELGVQLEVQRVG